MDAARFRRLSALFERARAATASERTALVVEIREDDESLANELCDLLSAHADDDGILGAELDLRPPLPGERIGPFRLLSALGDGGMGAVFRASVLDDGVGWRAGDVVALKLLHPTAVDSPRKRARFEREAALGASIVHRNVVRTLGGGAVRRGGRDVPYLVMEYVEGQTLRELGAELDAVPEELCRHVAREVARGLAQLHASRIVHRDVKPSNVIVTTDHCVKLMDLGVAHAERFTERLSRSGAFAGTVAYAAPEQFRSGSRDVDSRADLFALGTVLYELAGGVHPFRGDDAATTMSRITSDEPQALELLSLHVSPFFSSLVAWLLEKRPEARPDSAEAFLVALDAGSEGAWWEARRRAHADAEMRRRIRVARETGVHGRDDDLQALRDAFDAAASGDGRLLLLTGEAGIGKSRLVDEFAARLHREGCAHRFLYGSYAPGAEGLRDVVRELLTDDASRARIDAVLAPRSEVHLAFRNFVVAASGPVTDGAGAVASAVIAALRVESAETPLLLVLDDLHAASDEARALVLSVAPALAGDRVLLVGAARPDAQARWIAEVTRLGHGARRDLRRLGAKDLAALLRDAFRSERLAQELALRIAERTDGNPFFVIEVVRSLRDRGLITRSTDGSWSAGAVLQRIDVPETVRETVSARLVDLDDGDRELLDLAACAGPVFDADVLAAVQGASRLAVLRALARIERRHQLVRSVGQRFEFDHRHVRDVLHEELSPALRTELHRQLGRTLADRFDASAGDLGDGVGVSACRHLFAGGEPQRALPFLDAALGRLQARGDAAAIEELTGRALEPVGLVDGTRRIDLLERRHDVCRRLGRGEEAEQVLDAAVALAQGTGDVERELSLRLVRAGDHRLAGRHEDASREFGAVHAAADAAGLATIATDALVGAGDAHTARADLDGARDVLARARARALAESRPLVAVQAASQLINIAIRYQRFEEALALLEPTLPLAGELGTAGLVGRLESSHALVLRAMGRVEEAISVFRACAESARDAGDRALEASAVGNLANTYARTGRLRDALPLLQRVSALFEELGDAHGALSAALNTSNVLGQLGRFDESLVVSARGLELARRVGDDVTAANLLGASGSVHYELGRFAAAADLHRQRVALLEACGHVVFEVIGRADLAEALAALGELEEAEAEFVLACERAEAAPHALARARTATTFARFLHALGRGDEAAAYADTAIEIADELGDPQLRAAALIVRGAATGTRTDLELAVELARSHDLAALLVVGTAYLTERRGGDVEAARGVLREYGARVDAVSRLQVLAGLVRASSDPAVRAELVAELRAALESVLLENPVSRREVMRSSSPPIRAALLLD